ncbi:NADPH-dependent 1-acyldihydroxyacetone phosphate reductase [Diutina catenulata]
MTKFALIVGGTGGIGAALCRKFASLKYQVICFAPQKFEAEMQMLRDKYGVIPYSFDISSLDEIKRSVEFVRETTGGRLDTLYLNSGIAYGHPAIEFNDERMDLLYRVNLMGPIYVAKYMANFIVDARGAIVFTTSISARVPLAWTSIYGSSKTGLDVYARYLHDEMRPLGVSVYSVITGGVNTPIAVRAQSDSPQIQTQWYAVQGMRESMEQALEMTVSGTSPEAYAERIVPMIDHRRNVFNIYDGEHGSMMGYYSRFMPEWLVSRMINRKFKQDTVYENVEASEAKRRSSHGA